MFAEHFSKNEISLTLLPTITYIIGTKYYRIVLIGYDRFLRTYGFVEIDTGEIFKNLRGRAAKISSGNIYQHDFGYHCCTPDGIKLKTKKEEKCLQKLVDEEEGTYETSCGEMTIFTVGNVDENNYKFCPYCGKLIKEVNKNGKRS